MAGDGTVFQPSRMARSRCPPDDRGRSELPLPTRRLRRFLEAGASCFHDALCRYRRIHSERSSTGVSSEYPAPTSCRPRERMLIAAFASRSASNPHEGQERSRTHSGFSISTPQLAHSLVVSFGSTATKCVPSLSHLYPSSRLNLPHAADARLRELPGSSTNPLVSKSSTATRSYSVA
jgi:hypothetical protein